LLVEAEVAVDLNAAAGNEAAHLRPGRAFEEMLEGSGQRLPGEARRNVKGLRWHSTILTGPQGAGSEASNYKLQRPNKHQSAKDARFKTRLTFKYLVIDALNLFDHWSLVLGYSGVEKPTLFSTDS
jgi:hypothetical protein